MKQTIIRDIFWMFSAEIILKSSRMKRVFVQGEKSSLYN